MQNHSLIDKQVPSIVTREHAEIPNYGRSPISQFETVQDSNMGQPRAIGVGCDAYFQWEN